MDVPDEETVRLRKAVRSTGFPADTGRMKVSASSHEESRGSNVKPENTVNGDLAAKSSWRAEGDAQWIQFSLRSVQTLTGLRIAFVQGDQRTYDFDIALSTDGKTWKTVHSGTSSGETAGYEFIDFPDTPARHVRVIGHGGSKEKFKEWINITEVDLRAANF